MLLRRGCNHRMEHIIYSLTLGWEFLCLHFFVVVVAGIKQIRNVLNAYLQKHWGMSLSSASEPGQLFPPDSSLNQSSPEELLAGKKKQIKANPKKMNHAIIKGAFTSQDPRHWSENTPSESGPFDWCVSTSVSKQGSVLLCWVLCLLLLLWVYWRMANQLGEYSYIHMCTRVLNDMWGWEEGGQIHCNKYIIIYFLATWQHQREAGHNISSSFKLTWRIYSKAYSFFTQPAVMKQR